MIIVAGQLHALRQGVTAPGSEYEDGAVSEPVSLESGVSRNTDDIEALYGLIQEFEGRTRSNFARANQQFDDLERKIDGLAGQLGEVLSLLGKQS